MPRERITQDTCLSCGACCVSLHGDDAYCDFTHEDAARLGERFVSKHVIHESVFTTALRLLDGQQGPWGVIKTEWRRQARGPLKGFELRSCVALRGSVMQSVRCSVYQRRPDTCREAVVPGDRTCRQLRKLLRDRAK